jgi:hypothetical protein
VAACNARFGAGPVEPARLAAIRGDFYTEFVREAAAAVRSRGRRMHLHLHAEAFRPDPVFGQQNGVPANIDFQWRRWIEEGLADEVTLRTSWFEAAEDPLGSATRRSRLSRVLSDPVVADMLSAAAARNLPVTLNRYIGRAAGLGEYLDDLSQAAKDGRFSGFDVYEFFDLARANPEGPGLSPRLGRIDALASRWREVNRTRASRDSAS